MRRIWMAAPIVLILVAVVGAQQSDRTANEAAVRAVLDDYWSAVLRRDSRDLRRAVALPLVLLQPGTAEQEPERYYVDAAGWNSFAANFPNVPLLDAEVDFELANLRLEWLDPKSCLTVYDLVAEVQGQPVAGHFVSLVSDHEGWRVGVSSIPL